MVNLSSAAIAERIARHAHADQVDKADRPTPPASESVEVAGG